MTAPGAVQALGRAVRGVGVDGVDRPHAVVVQGADHVPVPRADVVGLVRALEKSGGRLIRFDTARGRLVGAALASLSRLEGAATDAFCPPPPLVRKIFYLSSRVLCLFLGA